MDGSPLRCDADQACYFHTHATRLLLSAARYLAGKSLTILATIFLPVFITMVIVDVPADIGGGLKMSPFQMLLESQIYWVLEVSAYQGLIPTDASGNPIQAEVDALETKLRSDAGLNLPFLPRYLLWTYKALTFNCGELRLDYLSQLDVSVAKGNRPPPNIVANLAMWTRWRSRKPTIFLWIQDYSCGNS